MRLLTALLIFIFTSCSNSTQEKSNELPADIVSSTIDSTKSLFVDSLIKENEVKTDTLSYYFKEFIPPRGSLISSKFGNLNLDKYRDAVLVVEDSSQLHRTLLILIGTFSNHYTIAKSSTTAVLMRGDGGVISEPLYGIGIQSGNFSITHLSGSYNRSERTLKFKYSPIDTNWFFESDFQQGSTVAHPEIVTTQTYTSKEYGKIAIDSFDINEDYFR